MAINSWFCCDLRTGSFFSAILVLITTLIHLILALVPFLIDEVQDTKIWGYADLSKSQRTIYIAHMTSDCVMCFATIYLLVALSSKTLRRRATLPLWSALVIAYLCVSAVAEGILTAHIGWVIITYALLGYLGVQIIVDMFAIICIVAYYLLMGRKAGTLVYAVEYPDNGYPNEGYDGHPNEGYIPHQEMEETPHYGEGYESDETGYRSDQEGHPRPRGRGLPRDGRYPPDQGEGRYPRGEGEAYLPEGRYDDFDEYPEGHPNGYPDEGPMEGYDDRYDDEEYPPEEIFDEIDDYLEGYDDEEGYEDDEYPDDIHGYPPDEGHRTGNIREHPPGGGHGIGDIRGRPREGRRFRGRGRTPTEEGSNAQSRLPRIRADDVPHEDNNDEDVMSLRALRRPGKPLLGRPAREHPGEHRFTREDEDEAHNARYDVTPDYTMYADYAGLGGLVGHAPPWVNNIDDDDEDEEEDGDDDEDDYDEDPYPVVEPNNYDDDDDESEDETESESDDADHHADDISEESSQVVRPHLSSMHKKRQMGVDIYQLQSKKHQNLLNELRKKTVPGVPKKKPAGEANPSGAGGAGASPLNSDNVHNKRPGGIVGNVRQRLEQLRSQKNDEGDRDRKLKNRIEQLRTQKGNNSTTNRLEQLRNQQQSSGGMTGDLKSRMDRLNQQHHKDEVKHSEGNNRLNRLMQDASKEIPHSRVINDKVREIGREKIIPDSNAAEMLDHGTEKPEPVRRISSGDNKDGGRGAGRIGTRGGRGGLGDRGRSREETGRHRMGSDGEERDEGKNEQRGYRRRGVGLEGKGRGDRGRGRGNRGRGDDRGGRSRRPAGGERGRGGRERGSRPEGGANGEGTQERGNDQRLEQGQSGERGRRKPGGGGRGEGTRERPDRNRQSRPGEGDHRQGQGENKHGPGEHKQGERGRLSRGDAGGGDEREKSAHDRRGGDDRPQHRGGRGRHHGVHEQSEATKDKPGETRQQTRPDHTNQNVLSREATIDRPGETRHQAKLDNPNKHIFSREVTKDKPGETRHQVRTDHPTHHVLSRENNRPTERPVATRYQPRPDNDNHHVLSRENTTDRPGETRHQARPVHHNVHVLSQAQVGGRSADHQRNAHDIVQEEREPGDGIPGDEIARLFAKNSKNPVMELSRKQHVEEQGLTITEDDDDISERKAVTDLKSLFH